MLNYGVYLHIPGSFQRKEELDGLWHYVQNESIKYTLHRSGNSDKDFIYDISLSLEVNKSGSFEFSILPSHSYYYMLRRYVHYISVEDLDDNEVLFYGRIYSINMNMNGEKKVTVEGMLSSLLDCPVYNPGLDNNADIGQLYELEGTPKQLFEKAILAYRNLIRPDIDCGTIFSYANSYELEKIDVSNGQTVGDFIINELVNTVGGYIKTRYERTPGGSVHTYLDWLPDPSTEGYSETTNSQTIEFGVNILDIEAEYADDDVMTGVIPTWTDENDTKHWATVYTENVDNTDFKMLKPYIVGSGGNMGIGIQIIDLPELTDQSEAITAANRYAERYCNYNLNRIEFDSFKVKALDMHYFGNEAAQKIRLFDNVRLVSGPHGFYGTYMCTAIEMTLENPSDNRYTFSTYRPKASSNDKTLCRQLGIKESKKRKVHNS